MTSEEPLIDDLTLAMVGVFESPKLSLLKNHSKFKNIRVGINTLPLTLVRANNDRIQWEVTSITYSGIYNIGLKYCINGNKDFFTFTVSLSTEEDMPTFPVYSQFPSQFTMQTSTSTSSDIDTYSSVFEARIAGGRLTSVCNYPKNPLRTDLFTISFSFTVPLSGGTDPDIVSFGLPDQSFLSPSPSPTVSMSFTLDSFGSNLSEITCWVTNTNKKYMTRYAYPSEYVGAVIGASLVQTPESTPSVFSFRPCFQKVMKGSSKYLIERARYIWSVYSVPLEFSLFYKRLCQFMTDRYFLAGLASEVAEATRCSTRKCDEGEFTTSWLLQSHTKEFMHNLKNSDFAPYKYLFTDVYIGYDKFMLEDLPCDDRSLVRR